MIEKEKALLNAAAARHGHEWRDLLAWKVTPERVVIILPDGRKFKYTTQELQPVDPALAQAQPEPVNQPAATVKPAAKPTPRKRSPRSKK